jgi:hypothetical protein
MAGRWTRDEEKRLCDLAASGVTRSQAAAALSRTVEAVKERAAIIGVSFRLPPAAPRPRAPRLRSPPHKAGVLTSGLFLRTSRIPNNINTRSIDDRKKELAERIAKRHALSKGEIDRIFGKRVPL